MDTSSIYCVLTMHFKPLAIFSFQTVFIFTLEDDCNQNWIFCFPSAFWPLKIKIFTTFILYFFTQKLKDLNVLYYRYRSKCWYLFLKTALEAVGDENRPKFFKAYFIPLKLTNL